MLNDWPVIELTPKEMETLRRETWALCTRDGRNARKCGLSLKHCPPFRDPDMAISWKMGWRYEDQDIKQSQQTPD